MAHINTEVAVIGVGAMGSATLWRLAERGVKAVGFEQFRPGHDQGSSHGETRIFRTAYLEGPDYVPLARRAVRLWRELNEKAGEPLACENGALMLGGRDDPNIRGTLASILAHNLPYRLLDAEALRAEYPAHRVEDDTVGLAEEEGGYVRPEAAVVAMARLARSLGARIESGTRVERIEPRGAGVRVVAGEITCDARRAVVCAGPWLGKLLPDLGLPLRVSRQAVGWFPITGDPKMYAPERFPVFIRDVNAEVLPYGDAPTDASFYGFPTLDGNTVKLSIHHELGTTDPDHVERIVTMEDMRPIGAYARRYLNGIGTTPVQTSVCLYTNSPDHDFIVGAVPGMDWVVILGGFSGHGFKFAPAMGEVAADLALHGRTDLPIGFLSPERFTKAPISS